MAYCKQCGYTLSPIDNYCSYCGQEREEEERSLNFNKQIPLDGTFQRRSLSSSLSSYSRVPASKAIPVRRISQGDKTALALGIVVFLLLFSTTAILFTGGFNLLSRYTDQSMPTTIPFDDSPTPVQQILPPPPTRSQHPTPPPTTPPTAVPATTAVPTPRPTATPRPQPPASHISSQQQARAVIERYYSAINRRDYGNAYAQWKNKPSSYPLFRAGFAHTLQDSISIGNMTRQDNGTVLLQLTIAASERFTNGQTTTHFYEGSYLLGAQSDHRWSILSASIQLSA